MTALPDSSGSHIGSRPMRVLVLAPQPFFINRGTPIDVLLVLRALSERGDVRVDALVYPPGEDVDLPDVSLHRTPFFRKIGDVRPGFSLRKLMLDGIMFFVAWKMAHRERYDLIHAGEESVFMAMVLKWIYGIPYVYDLDSSVAQQMVEKFGALRMLAPIFDFFERRAIRGALANAPVCHALADLCRKHGSRKTVALHDISQLENPDRPKTGALNREIGSDGLILLYCGNLETYQGIDLLLDSFPRVLERNSGIELAIIGGVPEDIRHYRNKAEALGAADHVHFLGPRPFADLDRYLAEADILVAPRIRGVNTPMKIFPYMHSGKPVLLTRLPTHTQIVTDREAYLAPADPEGFAEGILALAADPELRRRLGENGRAFVEKNHVYAAHRDRVNALYDWIRVRLAERSESGASEAIRRFPEKERISS
jgi:glycosyltransferase involved in cell wall biosynthesis